MFHDDNFFKVAEEANKIVNEGDLFFILKERNGDFFIGKVADFSFSGNLFGFLPESCYEFSLRRNTWSKFNKQERWKFDLVHENGSFNERFISDTGLAYTMTIIDRGYRMMIEFYDNQESFKKRIRKVSILANTKIPIL